MPVTVYEVPITLAIRTDNLEVEGEVPMLAGMVPTCDEETGHVYMIQTARWECGPKTFTRLVDELLNCRVEDPKCLEAFKARLNSGVWDLLYRDAPIQVGKWTPEGRLWPA